jgi:hypothetical protein
LIDINPLVLAGITRTLGLAESVIVGLRYIVFEST